MKVYPVVQDADRYLSNSANYKYAKEYVKDVRENWRETAQSQSRVFTFILIAIAAFELVSRAAVEGLSVVGIEISDLSMIHKILPLLIAYLFYDYTVLYFRAREFRTLHQTLIEKLYPDITKNNLEEFLEPRTHSATFIYQFLGHNPSKLYNALRKGLYLSFWALIPLFQVYAYYLIFREFGASDPVIWVTLVGTLMLLFNVAAILRITGEMIEVESSQD